jgi:Ran GTPase-activating protein (RanGAP) involved in mRNA processing and transport
MQAAAGVVDDPPIVASDARVHQQIQAALAIESTIITELCITGGSGLELTVIAAERILECFVQQQQQPQQDDENDHDNSQQQRPQRPRFDTLSIWLYHVHDVANVWNVFRQRLPLCTSLRKLKLQAMKLDNDGLEILRPALYSHTSITTLDLSYSNRLEGQRGGDALRQLLQGNATLRDLSVRENPLGPQGASGPGRGLRGNTVLQKLNLFGCRMGNEGLASFLTAFAGATAAGGGGGGGNATTKSNNSCRANNKNKNTTLTHLDLAANSLRGAEGGRLVTVALRDCFTRLQVLILNHNDLGPDGAREMASGVAAAQPQLQRLELSGCWLGNEGVASLVPDGQVNRSLTILDLKCNSTPSLALHGETAIALARRCTNLDRLDVTEDILSPPDQRSRLERLLDRKRLCTQAMALAGAPFDVLWQFVEKQAHGHEHGLSAILIILQNDGEDQHFCTNRRLS